MGVIRCIYMCVSIMLLAHTVAQTYCGKDEKYEKEDFSVVTFFPFSVLFPPPPFVVSS